jgi:hypothetical protein
MRGYLIISHMCRAPSHVVSRQYICSVEPKKIANFFLFKFSTQSNKNLFVTGLRDCSTLQ